MAEPEEEEAPRVWNSGPKLTHLRPDLMDETIRIEISLTRRQWQILDEVRGGTARGRYLWSFLSDALRETFGDVPGVERSPRPKTSPTKMAVLPYAVARDAKEFDAEFEDF